MCQSCQFRKINIAHKKAIPVRHLQGNALTGTADKGSIELLNQLVVQFVAILLNVLLEDLGIDLCCDNVRVTKHATKVLNGYIMCDDMGYGDS